MERKLISLFTMMLCLVVKAQIYQVGETFTPTENNPDGNVYKVTKNVQNDLQCCMYECKSTGDVVLPFEVTDTKNNTGYVFKMTSSGDSYNGKAYKNSGIRSITFPEGMTSVNNHALDNGYKTLLACYIPSTVTSWSDTHTAASIAKIVVSPDNQYFKSSEDGTALIEKATNKLQILTCRSLPNVSWNKTDFFGSTSNDWTVTEFTKAHVPEGIQHIEEGALKSTKDINANPITDIYFPSTLIDWNDECFGSYPSGWINLHVAEGNPYWKDRDGIVYSAPTDEDCWEDTNGKKYGTTLARVPDYRYIASDAITIPEGVKTIKTYAFKANRLGSVTFSSTVTTIEELAFSSCTNLKTVTLGENVEEVSSNSFLLCTHLTDIFVVQENAKYSNGSYNTEGVGDGILFNKDRTILKTCPIAKTGEYVIPDATITVEKSAFNGSNLSNITIGQNVTTIEERAFYGLKNYMAEMYVGPNVVTVGAHAFYYCKFGKVKLGNKVQTLSSAVFSQGSIKDFEFEETSVCKSIGVQALRSVEMETFTFPASVEDIKGQVLGSTVKHVVFEDGSNLKSMSSSFIDATNLETIDFGNGHVNDFKLSGICKGLQKLTSVSIPAECTAITEQCFMNCTNLKNVTFGEGSKLSMIGTGVFAYSGLEAITLPDNLKTIETGAFKECTLLTDVHVPASTKSIHPLSFLDCTSLTNIDVARDNQTYATSDGMLCSKDKRILVIYPAGKITNSFNLICPSITTIGEYAFYDAKKLKSIVIPKKVNKIENYAFYLCDNLKMITFLGDVRPSSLETDVATDNAKSDDNQRDHRFGNMTNRGAAYIRESVTVNIRHNEKTQASFQAADSYWYGAEPRTSFEATYANSTRTDGKNEFEYMFMSDLNELGVVQCNSTDYTAVMPATAKWTDGKEYPVKLIADYAFEAIPSTVEEMVFLGPIEYVGANAFNNGHLTTYDSEKNSFVTAYTENPTSNIKNIFFTDYTANVDNTFATVRFGLNSNEKAKSEELYGDWGTENYPEFAATQHIYMPKSKEKKFREETAVNFADQMTYKIPGISISTNFGSFSREFDVDLSDINEVEGESVSANWDETQGKPKVIAYTAKVKNFEKDGNVVAIRVKSINCKTTSDAHDGDGTNTDGDGDGTYIPANTGVLLQAIDGTTPTDFYYRIGERKGTFTSPADNIMMPVVENSLTISPTDNYIVSGGTYKYLTNDKLIPVHKSYLHVTGIANTPGNAKTLRLIFSDDEDESTGIAAVSGSAEGEAEVYDLSGRRLQHISKSGMYIVNGKKVIVK